LKKVNLYSISSNTISLVDHLLGCGISFEGMKAISSFLSQDGIVLEELDLGLKKRISVAFHH